MNPSSQIGARLRTLRAEMGWSQANLGGRLGLSRSAVTQIELGNRSITADELVRFATIFRCSPSALLAEPEEDGPVTDEVALLDEMVGAIDDLDDDAGLKRGISRLFSLGRLLKEIEKELGVDVYGPEAFAYQGARARSPWEAMHQGYFAAEDERRRMDLGSAPIRDVDETLATLRVRASTLPLPPTVHGLFIRTPATGSFVVVNEEASAEERRFQLLHGLAHELFDRRSPWIVCDQHNRDALHEVRANAFASRFLLPTGGVQRYLHSLGKDTLAHSLGGMIEILSESTGSQVRDIRVRVSARSRRGAWELNACELSQVAGYFGVSSSLAAHSLSNMRQLTAIERDQLTGPDGRHNGSQARIAMRYTSDDRRRGHDVFVTRLIALLVEAHRRGIASMKRLEHIAEVLELDEEETLQLIGTSTNETTRGPAARLEEVSHGKDDNS